MCHVQVERLPLHHLHHRRAAPPDVVFVVPRGEGLRGVGVDPRRGLFLMLQSNRRLFPLHEGRRGDDILALTILAVEVDDIEDQRVFDFVVEKLGLALGAAI
ncbi:hypothetical protein ACFPTY_07720 [Halomonas beimenensis]|uniref:Uncharacterized protein n=1 Tax=Halomonas beimenensis TaxID=475662 RepID=A0A291P7H7_9GAMM|nr:hypothetical protein [Halomonas beimenensis]ATJ82873.1 hypothetical protein BEI_1886 [Halomonas beimenensis]